MAFSGRTVSVSRALIILFNEPAQQMDKHIDNSDKMSEFSSLH